MITSYYFTLPFLQAMKERISFPFVKGDKLVQIEAVGHVQTQWEEMWSQKKSLINQQDKNIPNYKNSGKEKLSENTWFERNKWVLNLQQKQTLEITFK